MTTIMEEYFTLFSIDAESEICYLEKKEIIAEDNLERNYLLLQEQEILKIAETLKCMDYKIFVVKKVLGTPNEYEIQS